MDSISASSITEGEFVRICTKLYEQLAGSNQNQVYASAKQILAFFGSGATISSSFLVPQAGSLGAKNSIDAVNPLDINQWKRYNTGYLKQTLHRLLDQKLIEHVAIGTKEMLRISKEGKMRVLSYALQNLSVKKGKWDGKWRLVLYDIDATKKSEQQAIRHALKSLGFYQMQKSVYISPYSISDEIENLRGFLGLGQNIKYMIVEKIEDDREYRTHFGL